MSQSPTATTPRNYPIFTCAWLSFTPGVPTVFFCALAAMQFVVAEIETWSAIRIRNNLPLSERNQPYISLLLVFVIGVLFTSLLLQTETSTDLQFRHEW